MSHPFEGLDGITDSAIFWGMMLIGLALMAFGGWCVWELIFWASSHVSIDVSTSG